MNECSQMRNDIKSLVELLVNCGEDVPGEILDRVHFDSQKQSIARSKSRAGILIDNHKPEFAQNTNVYSPDNTANHKNTVIIAGSRKAKGALPEDHLNVRLCDLDPATVGMEFVLR